MISRRKATYELVSMASGILGGALAGAIFNWVWRVVSDTDEAPEPTALDRGMGEVLVAGALQGAVFGVVKAILSRVTAQGYRRFTDSDDSINVGAAPNRRSRHAFTRSLPCWG